MIVTGRPGNRMSPRAVIRGGILTITAVDPADEGEYTCKALNTHGEHTARVSLFVQSMLCFYVCVNVYYIVWACLSFDDKMQDPQCKSLDFMVRTCLRLGLG